MAKLFLTRTFQKAFERLDRQNRERIRSALQKLASDPTAGKPLTGDLEGELSLRIGDYRVIYTIEADNVWLETVGHRREVYRKKK